MSDRKPAEELWIAVDRYFSEQLSLTDSAIDRALEANQTAGLPAIDVAPNQGRFLQLCARMKGARRILEIGTLGGYSTIWLARALPPDGTLITLERNPKHAEVARSNISRANLAHLVEIRIGAALDLLPKIRNEMRAPFDMIFIDADKPNNANYFDWALKLSRVGTLIVVDNVVRDGAVADLSSNDENIVGARRLFETLAREKRVSATALQTVGVKGYDGFVLALVTSLD